MLSVAYTVALLVYMVCSHTQSVASHHSAVEQPHVLGLAAYVLLLASTGHAAGSMCTMSNTVDGYSPETVTSHYVSWWYGSQVVVAMLVMLTVRMAMPIAPHVAVS